MINDLHPVSVPRELLEQALDAAAAVGMQDVADGLDRILTPTTAKAAELIDVLPSVAIEGDQLVIRITTECSCMRSLAHRNGQSTTRALRSASKTVRY